VPPTTDSHWLGSGSSANAASGPRTICSVIGRGRKPPTETSWVRPPPSPTGRTGTSSSNRAHPCSTTALMHSRERATSKARPSSWMPKRCVRSCEPKRRSSGSLASRCSAGRKSPQSELDKRSPRSTTARTSMELSRAAAVCTRILPPGRTNERWWERLGRITRSAWAATTSRPSRRGPSTATCSPGGGFRLVTACSAAAKGSTSTAAFGGTAAGIAMAARTGARTQGPNPPGKSWMPSTSRSMQCFSRPCEQYGQRWARSA
jgi:hypothetical protein